MVKNSKEEIQKTICLPSTVEETSIVYIKEEDVKNEIQGKLTDITDRDRDCTLQTGIVHYRQGLNTTDRDCTLQTGTVHYRQGLYITDRDCRLQTGTVDYRQGL